MLTQQTTTTIQNCAQHRLGSWDKELYSICSIKRKKSLVNKHCPWSMTRMLPVLLALSKNSMIHALFNFSSKFHDILKKFIFKCWFHFNRPLILLDFNPKDPSNHKENYIFTLKNVFLFEIDMLRNSALHWKILYNAQTVCWTKHKFGGHNHSLLTHAWQIFLSVFV